MEQTPQERSRQYYRENRERILQRVKEYQARQPDFKGQQRDYNQNYYYGHKIRKGKTNVALLSKLKLNSISEAPIEKPLEFFTVKQDAWA
jgi:hypothetical protein